MQPRPAARGEGSGERLVRAMFRAQDAGSIEEILTFIWWPSRSVLVFGDLVLTNTDPAERPPEVCHEQPEVVVSDVRAAGTGHRAQRDLGVRATGTAAHEAVRSASLILV
jgi:hypothetical protein